jgi:hypothetical protein
MATLNNLKVKPADVQNAHLTAAAVSEKIQVRLGREFGSDCGRIAVIVSALHVLKSACAMTCVNWDTNPARPMPMSGSGPKQDPEMDSSTLRPCFAVW